jgi:hypothetical protein
VPVLRVPPRDQAGAAVIGLLILVFFAGLVVGFFVGGLMLMASGN